ncbi:MAG TPA: 5'-nucleotidase C-terminal domain-containing protein, partial [Gemmatimonadaceae bacterium]|nr:5'-nucleotidase C-terminal domain-containing protein [Gemmatimonadaceae bacterium]
LLIDEAARRKTLKPADYFTPSWRLEPPELARQVQAAIDRTADFESVAKPAPAAMRAASAVAPAIAPAGAPATVLRIISTNDFHGALEAHPDGNAGNRGGAAQFATVIRRLQQECTGTCASVLVDGGDEFQGTPASNLAFGRPVLAVFNALGFAAAAIGNHDFDWGEDTLRARMREARYGMFAANITDAAGRAVPWIRPDTIVERGGIRVGIIGLATIATPATTKAANVADLRFHRAASIVTARAKDLRARGADVVIVVAHAGASCGNGACSGELADLAAGAAGIDAIAGGHTHNEFTAVIAGVPEMRARSSGRSVAYLDLPVDSASRRGIEPKIVYVGTDTVPPDPEIARIVASATASVRALVDRPIATVGETLHRTGSQYPLGNLIADAQRAATGADVAVMNNGGIRTDLRAGAATYGSFFELQPFGNMLVRVTVTGAELRDYLEHLVRGRTPASHVSGATITYDPEKRPGERIVRVTVGGRPLDPAAQYTLAMSDFMATTPDGLSIPRMEQRVESLGVVDLDALIDYVKALPGGVVRADPTVRITPVP